MQMPMGQMMQGMPEQFLAPVHWLGGVAVVTTIVLPRTRELPDVKDAIVAFEAFEQRFAKQAQSLDFSGRAVRSLHADQARCLGPISICVVVRSAPERGHQP